jgi:hypothetical protein
MISIFLVYFLVHWFWWMTDWFGKPHTRFPHLIFSQTMDEIYEREVNVGAEFRLYREVALHNPYTSSTRFLISFPVKMRSETLPVILLLGGLEIAQYSLNYIPHHGNNILIAYEYPYRPKYWYDQPPLLQLEWIRQSAMIVPMEICQIIRYLKSQPWYHDQGIILLGYSFGALFIPAIHDYLRSQQFPVKGIVIAYGGAEIYPILYANLKTFPGITRPVLSFYIYSALKPLEPTRFLQDRTDKPILIINGAYDKKIPPESYLPLHRYFRNHATIKILPSRHMHPKNPELIHTIIQISRDWLLEKELINP